MSDFYLPFGSGSVRCYENNGNRNFYCSIVSDNFSLSDNKLVLGGMPLSLYETNGKYILAIVDLQDSLLSSGSNLVIRGINFVTNGTGNQAIRVINSGSSSVLDEVIFRGMPLAINSDQELIFKKYTPSGPIDEIGFAIFGGVPILLRRYGENWFICINSGVPASSSSSSKSSSSSGSSSRSSSSRSSSSRSSSSRSSSSSASVTELFSACFSNPTSSPSVSGAEGASFCTDANGSYAESRTYTDVGSYKEWIWEKSGLEGLPLEHMTLSIRVDEVTEEVAASIVYSGTDQAWGGNDSIWTGYKVVTGSVSCSAGNLSGSFSLDSLSWCSGSVSVTL